MQLVNFEFEGSSQRRVDVHAGALSTDLFAAEQAGMAILSFISRSPVLPGVRIAMRFTTDAGSSIEIDGIARHYTMNTRGTYTVNVAVAPSHRKRLPALRACVGETRACTTPSRGKQPPSFLQDPGHQGPPTSSPCDSDPNAPLLLRVRGAPILLDHLVESNHLAEGGRLRIVVGPQARQGRSVVLEVGLGPMADELVLAGVITKPESIGPGRWEADLLVLPRHRRRVSYLAEVLRGRRQATARALARYEVCLQAHIIHKPRSTPVVVQCLSGGGVFIRSYMNPKIGSEIDLNISLPDQGQVRVAALVRWRSQRADRTGFGASFAGGQARIVSQIHRFAEHIAPPLDAEWVRP